MRFEIQGLTLSRNCISQWMLYLYFTFTTHACPCAWHCHNDIVVRCNKQIACFTQVVKQGAADSSERYKRYTHVTQIEETEVVDASHYSTLCSTCREVCHEQCQPNETTASGMFAAVLKCLI